MFSYKVKIKTLDGDKLYKGDLPFLPKIGEAIHFNNTYRVVDVVYHFFSMHDNKIGVTITVEKEAEERYFVMTDNADMAFAFNTIREAEDDCATTRETYNGNIHLFRAVEVHTYKAKE